MPWIGLCFGIAFNALANVLMKAGARRLTLSSGPGLVRHVISDPYLLLGVLSFGLALAGYTYALTRFPLAVAYPLMTGIGFIIVALAGAALFGERLLPLRLCGMAVILVGVVLVART